MKLIWTVLVFTLLWVIYMCVAPDIGEPKQFHFAYVEKGYEHYESSFNPHKVFEDWFLVHSDLSTVNFFVVVGNPLILWTPQTSEIEHEVPDGEFASTVMFIFRPRSDGLWFLFMYGYKDKDGMLNTFIWNEWDRRYKKMTSNV